MTNKDVPSSIVFDASEEILDYSGFRDLSDTHTIDVRNLIDELDVASDSGFRDIQGTPFGKLLQAIPIPVLLIDRSCTIVFANQYWEKISENYVSIVDQPFSSIFPKQSVAGEAHSFVERGFAIRKPLVASAVLEIDGSRIWGRMHFRSLRMESDAALVVLVEDLTGEKKQLILTEKHKEALLKAGTELEQRVKERTVELKTMNESLVREIGYRKQAEHSLSASRASFTSIVEKTSEGILVVDSANMVLYANPAAESLLNRSRDQLVGQHLGLRLSPGQTTEVKGKRLSGESGILELRVEATDWNEDPANLLMLRDITERKRAEQEMLKAEKLESLELVAGGIAHDFNNFLTATIANISLAKMHIVHDSEPYRALRNAEKACSGAKHLTHQLLTFTKAGEPVKKAASLAQMLRDGLVLALSGSKIKSELNIAADLWKTEVDRRQIGQAFQNTFINAVQAMPDGGTLTVRAENFPVDDTWNRNLLPGGRYIKISIKDTGCGIAPEHLAKISDPYFTSKPKGSGIGLATAYSIIRRHGGAIEVKSQVNIGTTFFIYLPADAECAVEPPVTDSGEKPALGSGMILIMDDDEAIRTVAKDLLTLLGYEVGLAADGAECIQLYKAAAEAGKPFSAVIMDLTIPGGMGGKEAIEKLRVIDPEVKAIVSSGYSTDPIMSNHQQYGFRGVVAKPYDAFELSQALNDLLVTQKTT
jgi:two-component system, cell cycle sensor histidine kinase and response regulator CckA